MQQNQANIFSQYMDGLSFDINQVLTKTENFTIEDLHAIGTVILKLYGERFIMGTRVDKELFDIVRKNIEVFGPIDLEMLVNFGNRDYTAEQIESMFDDQLKLEEDEYRNSPLIRVTSVRNIQNVIRYAMFPINQAMNVEELMTKESWSANDLVKINALLTGIISHTGESLEASNNLYAENAFAQALEKAVTKHNSCKFSLIFLEAFISFFEKIKFYRTKYENFTIDLTQEFDESRIIETAVNAGEQKNLEEKKQEAENIVDNKPEKFVEQLMLEYAEEDENAEPTVETYSKFIENLSKDYEAIFHIIKYLKNKGAEPHPETKFWKNHSNEVLELHRKTAEEYKAVMEKICAPIDPNRVKMVNLLVREVIKSLIISTNEQAQYFATQIAEDSIETWSHFQEILTLIENCNIRGSKIPAYAQLFTYVDSDPNYIEIRELFEKVSVIELKLDLHRILKEFFEAR